MELRKKRITAIIPVEFKWCEKILEGISEHLEKSINKWNGKLKGIVKSYNKIRILQQKCKILEEAGVILVPIKYSVEFYFPQVGQKLMAKVKNWNNREIGALTEVFNTVLTCESGKFEGEIWKDENSKEIKKDSVVRYVLEK